MPFKFLYSTRNISTLFIVFFFQFLSVSSYAQTIGGMRPSDDFDGDGIINSIDLDDHISCYEYDFSYNRI
jgi:hypothetical protein